MKYSVLLTLPPQESLVESASASKEKRQPNIPIGRTKTPDNFEIDTSFEAIPLGAIQGGDFAIEALKPKQSERFAVRGTIEAESPEAIPEKIGGQLLFADPAIDTFPYCTRAAQGNVSDVQVKLDTTTLRNRGLDGDNVAIAIMDSGINLQHLTSQLGHTPRFDAANSWKPNGMLTLPGKHPIDHGTMCAFDALIAAPKATLLDYPILAARSPGGNITGRTISTAVQAFSHLLANYAVAFAPGGPSNYSALVVNNSWGIYHPSWDFPTGHPGRFIDNIRHPFAGIVGLLANAGADILFAAGNCGSDCPDGRCNGRSAGAIMGSSAYDTVTTLAACLTTSEDRLGYSSQGPSIAKMPQQKPDLTAHAHFVGSEAYGTGSPDGGTSTACPVAAGCYAAIRTKKSPSALPPASLITQFQTTARTAPGTSAGWNPDYGFGIIDPVATANSLGL